MDDMAHTAIIITRELREYTDTKHSIENSNATYEQSITRSLAKLIDIIFRLANANIPIDAPKRNIANQ